MAPSLAPMSSGAKIDMWSDLVGMAGFEPAASCSQSRRANQAAPHPVEPNVAYRPRRQHPRGGGSPVRTDPPDALACPGSLLRLRYHRTGTLSVLTRYQARSSHRARGRSSMAEPQPSKLVMRVRFPSPAPTCNPRSEGDHTVTATHDRRCCQPVVPYACP
jgi:hypothetical protein